MTQRLTAGMTETPIHHPLGGVSSESRTQSGTTDATARTYNQRGLVTTETATRGGV